MTEINIGNDIPLAPRKRALILGASGGIGTALVKQLAAEDYLIAALAIDIERLDGVREAINEYYGEQRVLAYQHDVTQYETIPTLFQKILGDLKQIDVVLYVAGVQPVIQVNEYNFEKDRAMIEVNLLGAIAWLNEAAEFFERMGAGQILGISSVAGDRGRVGNPVYNTSKAGLSTYLEALRNRLTRKGVNVITIKPSPVDTELLRKHKPAGGGITPEAAALAISKAMRRRKQVVYVPGLWRYIMLVIQHIPSVIFRRLSF